MYVDMPIGESAVTLVYSVTRERDSYECWGAKYEDSGCVYDIDRVLYRGRPITLSYEWAERAQTFVENIGD